MKASKTPPVIPEEELVGWDKLPLDGGDDIARVYDPYTNMERSSVASIVGMLFGVQTNKRAQCLETPTKIVSDVRLTEVERIEH